MLFVYDSIQRGDAGFWRYRTRLPLDGDSLLLRDLARPAPAPEMPPTRRYWIAWQMPMAGRYSIAWQMPMAGPRRPYGQIWL